MTDNGERPAGSVADPGLACLLLVTRYHGIAAEAEALRHRFAAGAAPLSDRDLVRAARSVGLKARLTAATWEKLSALPTPALAFLADGGCVVLGRVAEDGVLVHDPREGRPALWTRADVQARWSGRLLLLTRRILALDGNARFGLAWFIPAILRFKGLFGEVLAASFALQLFALLSPIFFQVVIDKVLVHRGLTTLDVLILGLVAVTLFEGVLGGLRSYVLAHTTSRIDVLLGSRLFRHLLSLPLAFFEARRVGETIARVRELETIRGFLTGAALTLVLDFLFTFVFIGTMWFYSPMLTGVVLASLPLYVLLAVVVTPVLHARLKEKFARGAENQAFLVEAVTNIATAKSLAVEPQFQRRWEEALAAYVGAGFRAASLNNVAGQCVQVISKLTTAAILWVGARSVIEGDLTVGQLVAFNMLAGRVSAPVLRLAQLWQEFQQTRIAVDRLGDVLNAPAEPGTGGRSALPSVKGELRLERIRFRYRLDGGVVLSDLDLHVPAGQVVGIIGPSGSGKSTLAKLVQRLYVPESGRVLVDGVDLALVDPAWLRRQVGVVPQEAALFSRSVRENIALSDPGMPMARIVRAAQIAGAHEFIVQQPQGYDTVLGEHGVGLSGGQRQRIAIARALVNDPRLLIFDEATSALDYESERVIQANMRAICQGRTVLVIAHRLAAVRHADRILTIDGGRIVEDGRHEELLRRDGFYARLWRMQAGGEEAADGVA